MNHARARLLRSSARGVALLAVFLAVVTARVVIESKSELVAGHANMEAGNVDAAIVHYRRAVRWYAPLSPYPVVALDALTAIAHESEGEGQGDRALSAWRAVRGGILSTRSTYVPHQRYLHVADRRIAALMAAEPPPPIDAELGQAQREQAYLSLLRRAPGPRLAWSITALLGFALWVGAAFAFSSRAIDADDRLVRVEAMRWAAAWALGMALFCAGLALA